MNIILSRNAILLTVIFALVGCGPSASEQKARLDLAEAQKKIAVLEAELNAIREIKKANYEVTGEIFIVTDGGINIRLGLVEILVYERNVIDQLITSVDKERIKLLNSLEPTKEMFEELYSLSPDYENAPRKEYYRLLSGDPYFRALPPPILSVKSNSDGKFKFSIRRESEIVVAAHASRSVGDSLENYYWMIPVSHPAGNSIEITLSNDNLSSVKGGSLIFTSLPPPPKRLDEQKKAAETAKGTLVGSATYYFNENFGYKPDVGAEIYIWKQEAYPNFNPEHYYDYRFMKSSAEDWEKRGEDLFKELLIPETGKETIQLTVDGSGGFRRSLSPGEYYVLVQSAHRKAHSIVEVHGQISLERVEIKPGEETDISAKFNVQ